MSRKGRRGRTDALRQQPVPQMKAPERKTVTPEELSERWNARRQAAQEKPAGEVRAVRGRRLRLGVTTGLLLATGAVVLLSSSTSAQNETLVREASSEVSVLQEQKAQAIDTAEALPDAEVAKRVYTSSSEKGQALADLQNQYLTLEKDKVTDGVSLNEVKSQLGEHFEESAVSGAWDPRQSWFSGGGGEGYSWTFESTHSMAGTEVNAAWILRDSEGTMLAWVMGVYDGETEKFGDLRLGVTRTGSEMINPTEANPHEHDESDTAPEIDHDPDSIGGDGEEL